MHHQRILLLKPYLIRDPMVLLSDVLRMRHLEELLHERLAFQDLLLCLFGAAECMAHHGMAKPHDIDLWILVVAAQGLPELLSELHVHFL